MKSLKYIFLAIFLFNSTVLYAETPYLLNFKFVLNESVAGKKAQDFLKKKIK